MARPLQHQVQDWGCGVSDDDFEIEDSTAEFLGVFNTVEDYFKSQIEELLIPAGLWILECLNMSAILCKMEDAGAGNRWRYFVAGGKVYRELILKGGQQ